MGGKVPQRKVTSGFSLNFQNKCRARGEPSTKSPRGGRVEEETPFFHAKSVPGGPGSHVESFWEHLKNIQKITIFGPLGASGPSLTPGFLGAYGAPEPAD